MLNGTNLLFSPNVDRDTYWKVTKAQENTTHKRAKKPALSQQVAISLQGTDMTAKQRQTRNITNKNDPQKKHHLLMVSKITGGHEHVYL